MAPEQSAIQRAIEEARKRQAAQRQQGEQLSKLSPIQAAVERRRMRAREEQLAGGKPETQQASMAALGGMATSLAEELMQVPFAEKGRFAPGPVMRELALRATQDQPFTAEQMRELTEKSQAEMSDRLAGGFVSEFMYGSSKAVTGKIAATGRGLAMTAPGTSAEAFMRGAQEAATPQVDSVTSNVGSAITQGGLSVGQLAVASYLGVPWVSAVQTFVEGAGSGMFEYEQKYLEGALEGQRAMDPLDRADQYRSALIEGTIQSATEYYGGKLIMGTVGRFVKKGLPSAIDKGIARGIGRTAWNITKATARPVIGGAAIEGSEEVLAKTASEQLKPLATKEKRPPIAETASGLAREFAYGAIGGFGGTVAAAPTAIIERRQQIAQLNRALRASNTEYENDDVWERIAPAKIASMLAMTPDERVKEIDATRESALQAVQAVATGRQQISLLQTELGKAQKALKAARRRNDATKVAQAESTIAGLKSQISTAESGVAVLAADAAAASLAYDAAVAFMARNAPQVEISVDDALREQGATASSARTGADKQAEKELSAVGYRVVFYEGGQEGTDAFYHPMVPNTLFLPSGQASAAKAIGIGYEEAVHAIQYADGRLWSELRQQFDERGVVESAVRYFNQDTNAEDITARAALEATVDQTTTPARPAEVVTRRYGSALAVSEGTANEIRDGIEVLFRTGEAPGLLGSIIARMGLRGRQAATAFRVRQAIIAAKSTRQTKGFSEAGLRLVEAKQGVAARAALAEEAAKRLTAKPAAPAPVAAPAPTPTPGPAAGPVSPARTKAPRQGKHAETINAMVGFGFEYLGKESDRWGRGLVYKFKKPESVTAYAQAPNQDGEVVYTISMMRDEVGFQTRRATPVSEARTRTSDIGHKREKATGRYVGAPDWVGSDPAKLRSLRKMLRKLALEGDRGRYWYERSSKAILEAVDGDIVEAEKLVALIAIYSPTATVPANTSMAFTAYYQWKAGQDINAGYGASDKKATDLLVNGIRWDGIKTNSFYQNLMIEIDPSVVDPNVATMDMWIALAFDYGSLALDQGPKYKFAEREIQNLAVELGWKPHQVQAAIWTAIKGRIDPIRGALKERELQLGIGEIVKKKDPKTGEMKESYQVKKGREYEHFRLAHKMGMEYGVQPQDIEASSYDFSNAISDRMVQISWEATPSRAAGMPLPGIHSAPVRQKIEYANAVQKVLVVDGRDVISDMVGLPQGRTIRGLSAWDAVIGAGFQTFIPVPLEGAGSKRAIKPIAENSIRMASVIRAFALRQDLIAYHTPMFDGAASRENGVQILTQRALTTAEMRRLYNALIAKFGTTKIAPGYIDSGARILNFEQNLSNTDFQQRVREVYDALPDNFGGGLIDFGRYRSIGNMVDNDWSKNPNGETYTQIIAAERPDLLGRAKRLQADVDAVNRRFAAKYGWDKRVVSAARRRDGGVGDRVEQVAAGTLSALAGAPRINGFTGPDPAIVAIAERYAAERGIPFSRQAEYAEVDVARAERIAAAYEAMRHDPQDPAVAEAYRDLIAQTRAQYDALVAAGYQFYFVDLANDPYASQPGGFGNPYNAVRDLRANKRMAVFPTESGFGSGATDIDVSNSPLLADTGLQWPYGTTNGQLKRVTANDLFRAVHDAFGHSLEGAGFRARGEENAWQAHVRLFVGPAVGAMTSETRGQNSWLNFGPFGAKNQTAKIEDTTFADQKVGLMPAWTWSEGRVPDSASAISAARTRTDTPEFRNWFRNSKVVDAEGKPLVVYHGTNKDFDRFTDVNAELPGLYFFTPDAAFADGFTRSIGQIVPVYLSIQNPFIPWSDNGMELIRQFLASGESNTYKADLGKMLSESAQDREISVEEWISQGEWSSIEHPALVNFIKGRKHDGMLVGEDGIESWVAFNPNQIKSVFNRGTFDPQSALISEARTRVEAAAYSPPAVFYSSLAKYLAKSITVSPSQLMKEINKAVENGVVKRDEVYWSGIMNLLPMMEEQGKAVSPQILLGMLQTFVVHNYGYRGDPAAMEAQRALERFRTRVSLNRLETYRSILTDEQFAELAKSWKSSWQVEQLDVPSNTWGPLYHDGKRLIAPDDSEQSREQMEAARDSYIESRAQQVPQIGEGSIRYPQTEYSVAGGANAREMVLSLRQGMVDRATGEFLTASQSQKKVALIEPYTEGLVSPTIEARHFSGVRNQILHIRANDRVIERDGKQLRILFGEEFQSDWRSAGEESGFITADADERQRIAEEYEVARNAYNRFPRALAQRQSELFADALGAFGMRIGSEMFERIDDANWERWKLKDRSAKALGLWRWIAMIDWMPTILQPEFQVSGNPSNVDNPIGGGANLISELRALTAGSMNFVMGTPSDSPHSKVDVRKADDDAYASAILTNSTELAYASMDGPMSIGQVKRLKHRHQVVRDVLPWLMFLHHDEFIDALPLAYKPEQLGARKVEDMRDFDSYLNPTVREIDDALIARFFDVTTETTVSETLGDEVERISFRLKPAYEVPSSKIDSAQSTVEFFRAMQQEEARLEELRRRRDAMSGAMGAVQAGPWVAAPRYDVMTQGQGPVSPAGVAPAEAVAATFASREEAEAFVESVQRPLPEGFMVPQRPDERTGLPRPPKERQPKAGISGVSRVAEPRMVAQTDQILQLALKQFLMTAVNEGYDGVAFINGRQTAERYRVSKYIVRLSHRPANREYEAPYGVPASMREPQWRVDELLYRPSDSDPSNVRLIRNSRVGTLKELTAVYGEAIAQQIANGEGEVRGDMQDLYHSELKTRQSGWEYLYDTVLPKNVDRLLKTLKAGSTTRVQISVPRARLVTNAGRTETGGWGVTVNGNPVYEQPYADQAFGGTAPEMTERLAREIVATIESWNQDSANESQLAIMMTDELDAAVRKGLASFARSRKAEQRQESLAYGMGRRSGQIGGMIRGREQGIREGETRQKAFELARRRQMRARFAARVAEFESRIERDAERIDGLRDRLREMREAAQAGREDLMEAARKRVLKAWFAGQQKGANAGFEQAKREMVQMRRDANKIIKLLPPSMRGKYISALAEMRTVSGIDRVAQRVVRDLATADAIDTVSSINSMLKRAKKVGLRNDTREEINGLLLSARAMLVTGTRRLLPFTSTADLANRIAAANDLLEQAMTAYDEERGEWREARDLRAMEIEQDSETLATTLSRQQGLPPDPLMSRAPQPGMAQRLLSNFGNLDIYTIMHRLEGGESGVLGKIWSGLIAGKDRMIKARRALDIRIDDALRRAGYDGYDGYAARASGLYGDATAETVEVMIGGSMRRITVDEMLHLAALDADTVATLLDENDIESGGSPIVFGGNRFAEPLAFTKQEHARLATSLSMQHRRLVEELKTILEEDVQPTLFEVHFQATGRQPPVVEGYFPRRRLGDEVVGLTEETLNMQPSQAINGMLQNAGFLQQRVQSRAALVIGGMMRTYDSHLDEALRVIHLSTPLRRAITVLRRRSVRSNINRILGRDGNDSIRKLVMNGVGLSGRPSGDFVEAITSNMSGALLTLNPKTWIRQLGGAFRLATEFPLTHWMAGMMRTAAMSPAERTRIIQEIESQSGYFYERHRRSQVGLFANVIGDPRTGKEQWSNAIRAVGRALQSAGQDAAALQWSRAAEDVRQGTVAISRILRSADFALRAIDRQIMLVAYNSGLSQMQEAGATDEAMQIGAAKLAERAFRKTQNISDPLDDTVAGARWKFKQGLGRLMFPFSSDPLKGYNQIRRAIGSGDSTEIAKTSAAIAGNVALSAAVNPIFAAVAFGIKAAFDAGDDDEVIAEMLARREGRNMVRRMATDALGTTTGYAGLLASGIIETAIQNPMLAGDAGEPLAIRAIGDFGMAIAQSNYGEATGIAAQMAGIPVTTPVAQIVRSIEAVQPERSKLIAEYRRIKKERGLTQAQENRLAQLEKESRLEKLKTAP